MADLLISHVLARLAIFLRPSPSILPRKPRVSQPTTALQELTQIRTTHTMTSICAACSRLLSRPAIPSSSRLPTSLPRLPPPRHFSTLLAPYFQHRVPRSDPKPCRLASTSAYNPSRSGLPDLPPIPSRPNIQVSAPSLAAIKEEGFYDDDVKLLPPEEAILNITQEAVQVSSTQTSSSESL